MPGTFSSPVVTARSTAVASTWHTVVVLAALLSFSLIGAYSGNLFVSSHGRMTVYVLVIVFQWISVAFIWYGLRLRGLTLSDLIGGSWPGPVAFCRDFAIAIGFLIVVIIVLQGVGYFLNPVPNKAIRNLIPQTPAEITLFLILTATAGFCEEVIYRGYLQRQFATLTRSAIGGILLQGIAFGVGHGYQGWRFVLIIAVAGIMFGLLAHWRGSLRPGMIAHFLANLVAP